MKFLHVSDLHFHRGQADNKEANTTLATLRAKFSDHRLIVTGDITDDGHEEQYANALKALKPFATTGIYIAPGNHDFGAVGNIYSRERAERFDRMLADPLTQGGTFTGDQTPVVNVVREGTDVAMLIALDTNLETENMFDFACGAVGEKQRAALDTILASPRYPNEKRIVFFHHHPFMHNDPFMHLKDAEQLLRVLYKRVDLVLFGHKHVSAKWKNRSGVEDILASDNTPGKAFVREIEVSNGALTIRDVSVAPGASGKKGKKSA